MADPSMWCEKNSSKSTGSGGRKKLTRQDTANESDKSIASVTGTEEKNGLSKDIVTDDIVRRKAFRWCQDSIGGAWMQIKSEQDLTITPICGGMSNYLYLVALPAHVQADTSEPSQVLLRIYGQISKSTLDFLVHNSVVFALLAERKLGPKPYGLYHDGRIEEFIKAKPLSTGDLRKPYVMDMMAEKLAHFHSLDMPLCKKPRWFKSLIRGWIKDIQKNLSNNSGTIAALLKMEPSFDMETEFIDLINIASKLKCPVVFCHNDLQGGNLLLAEKPTPSTPRLTIIDWEYGHYNYRGFDLGNHFNEWTFDYSSTGLPGFTHSPNNFPTREEQYRFFRCYLQASGMEKVTEADLAAIYRETNTLVMHSHFLWGVWSMFQALTSSIEFDYSAYALARFKSYFSLKERLPNLLAEVPSDR